MPAGEPENNDAAAPLPENVTQNRVPKAQISFVQIQT